MSFERLNIGGNRGVSIGASSHDGGSRNYIELHEPRSGVRPPNISYNRTGHSMIIDALTVDSFKISPPGGSPGAGAILIDEDGTGEARWRYPAAREVSPVVIEREVAPGPMVSLAYVSIEEVPEAWSWQPIAGPVLYNNKELGYSGSQIICGSSIIYDPLLGRFYIKDSAVYKIMISQAIDCDNYAGTVLSDGYLKFVRVLDNEDTETIGLTSGRIEVTPGYSDIAHRIPVHIEIVAHLSVGNYAVYIEPEDGSQGLLLGRGSCLIEKII